MHNKESNPDQKVKFNESGRVNQIALYTEIRSLNLRLEGARSSPDEFWDENKGEILQRLKKKFPTLTENSIPDVELSVPVHRSYTDLVSLLYCLSLLDVTNLGKVKLTFIMHNNSNEVYDCFPKDKSWDLLSECVDADICADVKSLAHPLLTGPYISWQYLLCQTNGNINAVLDADTICAQSWLKKITYQLRTYEQTYAFAGGERLLLGGTEKLRTGSQLYLLFNAVRKAFKGNIYLPGEFRFMGGQASYTKQLAQQVGEVLLGMPMGDGMFGLIAAEIHGNNNFYHSSEFVGNYVDNYRQMDSFAEVGNKVLSIIKSALNPFKLNKAPDNNQSTQDTEAKNEQAAEAYIDTVLMRYCHWFRGFYKVFKSEGQLTKEKILEMLENLSVSTGFDKSDYQLSIEQSIPDEVIEYYKKFAIPLDTKIFDVYKSHYDMVKFSNTFGYLVLRPLLEERLKNPNSQN